MARLRSNNYSRAVAEAQDLARTSSASHPLAGGDLYNLACSFALASMAARADKQLSFAERQRLAKSYAATALEWLERTAESGFLEDPDHRDQARRDPDLGPLRDTSEFRKLLPGNTP